MINSFEINPITDQFVCRNQLVGTNRFRSSSANLYTTPSVSFDVFIIFNVMENMLLTTWMSLFDKVYIGAVPSCPDSSQKTETLNGVDNSNEKISSNKI